MHPLLLILSWFESLDPFLRFRFGTHICIALTAHDIDTIAGEYERLVRQLLSEQLNVFKHAGRAVAVRGAIDFEFAKGDIRKPLDSLLEAVEETASATLKQAANEAIARHLKGASAEREARRTWRELRRGQLSDVSLVRWEQKNAVH